MLGNVTNSLLEAKMQRQESLNSILGSNIIKNKSNGYGAQNQDLLIDSTDISKTAVDMYQRELDIKNFTKQKKRELCVFLFPQSSLFCFYCEFRICFTNALGKARICALFEKSDTKTFRYTNKKGCPIKEHPFIKFLKILKKLFTKSFLSKKHPYP